MRVTRWYVGCAGWSIPRASAGRFPPAGSHLERYAGALPAVEINSSFYRPHRVTTYARWAGSVPEGFRFAVKVPRSITHEAKLRNADALLTAFLREVAGLGAKLGVLLVQLPPSLVFDAPVAGAFFTGLRERHAGGVACEPRHESWFEAAATEVLCESRVARVAADPARVPAAAEPGGWPGLVYHRLHGSPKMYHSNYSAARLAEMTQAIADASKTRRHGASAEVWCVFDNTATGAATENALDLWARLGTQG